MFKKNKNTIQPPTAPRADEILEDITIFQVDRPLSSKSRRVDTSNSLPDWWKAFETFVEDVEDLASVQTEINGYKLKLESTKLDVETKSKIIKNDIAKTLPAINLEQAS